MDGGQGVGAGGVVAPERVGLRCLVMVVVGGFSVRGEGHQGCLRGRVRLPLLSCCRRALHSAACAATPTCPVWGCHVSFCKTRIIHESKRNSQEVAHMSSTA